MPNDDGDGSWRWAGARAVGTSHQVTGAPCQDAFAVCEVTTPSGPVLIAAVADGAGSATHARDGSRAVVRGMIREARAHFAADADLPTAEIVTAWIASVRRDVEAMADERAATPRDFASTLVAALVNDREGVIIHVGDGAAALEIDAGWVVPSWPAGGEYAGTTYFVTDAPAPRIVLTPIVGRIDAVALFSDSIESLVLDKATRQPHPAWFNDMAGVMRQAAGGGRDRALCRSLRWYLRRDEMGALTHDDTSIVLAVRR